MKIWLKKNLSKRQYELLRMLAFEWKRFKCRLFAPSKFKTTHTKLHLGSGSRRLQGWLNVDMVDSDLNLDIANGKLPFDDHQFEAIVCQHVIEHLTLEDELIPLFRECHRSMKSQGVFWLSTPDMEKVSKSYIENKNLDMIEDRQQRLAGWSLKGLPQQHFMNDMFHQQLEHRNLFDFELLAWALSQVGFQSVVRVNERDLLKAHPEFPARNDDYQSLYVKAIKS